MLRAVLDSTQKKMNIPTPKQTKKIKFTNKNIFKSYRDWTKVKNAPHLKNEAGHQDAVFTTQFF